MNALKNEFRSAYKIAFDEVIDIPQEIELTPADHATAEAGGPLEYVDVKTKEDSGHIFRLAGDSGIFVEKAPLGYFHVGFWGHGVNSYAFYYSIKTESLQILLRLPYGGIYMDNDEKGELGRVYLISFFEFLAQPPEGFQKFTAIEGPGLGKYALERSGGEILEFDRSLFENPDFYRIFS